MNREAKKTRNEYYRNWRAKNRDKVKAAQDRYWAKQAAEKAKKEEDSNDDGCSRSQGNCETRES